MRKGAFALVAVAATLVSAATASAREPILFVHGWAGNAWN
jgi:ABC-type sugar transport system substrate-binding protein